MKVIFLSLWVYAASFYANARDDFDTKSVKSDVTAKIYSSNNRGPVKALDDHVNDNFDTRSVATVYPNLRKLVVQHVNQVPTGPTHEKFY